MKKLLAAAAISAALLYPAKASYDPHSFTQTAVKHEKVKRVAHRHKARHHRQSHARVRRGVSVANVVAPLKAKADEIVSACGSVVISGVRHTRVAGSGRMSLHASGRAVDIQGNPACIYSHLRGWPGGYSIDYGRVKHVHVSWGGREAGLRFAHYRHRVRYAHLR